MANQEDEWGRLFELFPDMLCVADFLGQLKHVNRAWTEILGYPAEQLRTMNYVDLVHPDDRAWIRAKLFQLGQGQPFSDIEFRIRCADDSYRWTSWAAHASVEEGVIYAVARDSQQRHHLEEQLRRSQRMDAISQLAGGIAHDFNNLLQAILINSAFVLQELPDDSPLAEHVSSIESASERAADLTHRLLSFARREPLSKDAINLNHVVHATTQMLLQLIPENITLELEIAPDLPEISGDSVPLEEVLMNLCLNARDALPNGGSLTIETDAVELTKKQARELNATPGSYVRLTVSDTGSGMSAEVREHIFEPFFTTKDLGKGTGLGLATSYGIVQQHDGFIEVQSAPGKGSSFEVYFPASPVLAPEPVDVSIETVVGGTETILLAEDDPLVRNVTRETLERAGYKVITAVDGAEALRLHHVHGESIDFVLLDVIMPRIGGPEVRRTLLRTRPDLPIILTTGYADPRILDGHGTVVVKPFHPNALLKVVRAALDAVPQRRADELPAGR